MSKSCVGCTRDFPERTYQIKQRWNDGSVRTRHARCPVCLAAQRRDQQIRYRQRKASPVPVDAEITPSLPIEPWRNWIEGELLRLSFDSGVDPQALLAARMHVDDRRLYAWRRCTQQVALDVIDRACCAMGEPQLLRELYPALYQFDGLVAA